MAHLVVSPVSALGAKDAYECAGFQDTLLVVIYDEACFSNP
jgi:hypothetical protein